MEAMFDIYSYSPLFPSNSIFYIQLVYLPMIIKQRDITLRSYPRGFHLITDEVLSSLNEIKDINAGMLHVFIRHTSASLTVNENADPTVRHDFETFFNRTVPEDTRLYKHTLEGTDDMTSHIKSSLLGSSVSIPVKDGKLHTGVWQGIYLCEHRNRASGRNLTLTLWGI